MTLIFDPGAAMTPAEVITRRLIPAPRRPEATGERPVYHPRTIGIVDRPLETAEIPLLAQLAAYTAEAERVRWRHRGRHRGPASDRVGLVVPYLGGAAAGGLLVVVAQLLIGAGW